MADLGINGKGNTRADAHNASTSRNKAKKRANHKNTVWGEFKDNGDNIVNAEDVKIKENATNLQKRAIRDFLGVHNGKQWTEKLINIVKNLFTNNNAIEEVSNNKVCSEINIKDENGEIYQTSYDNVLDGGELGYQKNSKIINKNEDGTTVVTECCYLYSSHPQTYTMLYDKEGFLVSSKNEKSGSTANFDKETGKITFTYDGEAYCYTIKDNNGNMIYYLPDGQEIGDRNAMWSYINKTGDL